jgi:AAA domain/Iron dependent repressor, N-terminal DNA binding domain
MKNRLKEFKPRTTWSDTLLQEELRAHVNAAMRMPPLLNDDILVALKKAAVKGEAFRKLVIPSREKLLDDWFRDGDTGFIYSHRGVGKTWLAWAIARAIARGEGVGPWQAGEHAVSVCYLDGEMPAELMQERDKAFGDACENLTLINHEILFQRTGLVLNLAEPEVQAAIMQWCVEGGFKVLVIDNLSTLASGVKENDADAWEILLPWLLDLRRRKIAVLLVHHAGRSGEMRGTSRREDSVFWIVKLERESDYTDKGCSFLVRFEKNRNSALNPDSHVWTIKPSADPFSSKVEITFRVASFQDQVFDLIRDGVVRCTAIAKELDCQPSTVSKAAKKLEAEGKIACTGRTYRLLEACSPIDKELFERAAKIQEDGKSKPVKKPETKVKPGNEK